MATLDLSNNRLLRLDDAAFTTLPNLAYLDLSNNNELKVMDKAFLGLEDCLFTLSLNNVSLTAVPELTLPSLRALHLSRNALPFIPQELAYNLTSLRLLDVSGNDLTTVPSVIHSLPQLRYAKKKSNNDNLKMETSIQLLIFIQFNASEFLSLSLSFSLFVFRSLSIAANPITALNNNTFGGILDKLDHLDISSLQLNLLEVFYLLKRKLLFYSDHFCCCGFFFTFLRTVPWVNPHRCVHYVYQHIQICPILIFRKLLKIC